MKNTTLNTEGAITILIGVAMFVVYICFLCVNAIESNNAIALYYYFRMCVSLIVIGVGVSIV